MKLPKVLQEIRNTNSHLKKVKLIQAYQSVLTMPLYYAYSPFKRFHLKFIPKSIKGRGTRIISPKFYKFLDACASRTIGGDQAKKLLQKYLEDMTPEYAEVAKLIVKKNLSIGCNYALINKAYERPLIEVHKLMLAKTYDPSRPLSYPVLVAPKVDGIRAIFRNGKFYSRNGHELIGLEHLATTILFRGIQHPLDGELWVPNVPFETLSGMIRSHEAHKSAVRFAVFDMLCPGLDQTQRLEKLSGCFANLGLGFDVEQVPHIVVEDDATLQLNYRRFRSKGYEGLMLKDPKAMYEHKRSWAWQKMKPAHDAEYEILGAFEGEGKFKDSLGGFVIDNNGTETRVGSGFSDAERTRIWANPDKYIGKYATVECMEKTASGNLRHPIFKGMRWDI